MSIVGKVVVETVEPELDGSEEDIMEDSSARENSLGEVSCVTPIRMREWEQSVVSSQKKVQQYLIEVNETTQSLLRCGCNTSSSSSSLARACKWRDLLLQAVRVEKQAIDLVSHYIQLLEKRQEIGAYMEENERELDAVSTCRVRL